MTLLPADAAVTSNFELLNLMFVKHLMDREVVWLLGTVVEYIWEEKFVRKRRVKLEHLIGRIQLKFKANEYSRKPRLNYIIGIN